MTADEQVPDIRFDPLPQERSWTDSTTPGKEMVGALGYSGPEAEENLRYFYEEFDVPTVSIGVAYVMEGILREYPVKSLLLDLQARDGSPCIAFREILTDVRDFLRIRYRCEGLSIESTEAMNLVRIASQYAWARKDRGPDWIINLVVTALAALLNTDQTSDDGILLFRPTVRGIRDLCRVVHDETDLHRNAGYDPMIDEMLREHFKE